MRYHLGLFGILLVVLGLFSCLALMFDERHLFYFHNSNSNKDVGRFLSSFQKTHRPIVEINFTALYGGGGQFQVLHHLLDMTRIRLNEQAPFCGGIDLDLQPSRIGAQTYRTSQWTDPTRGGQPPVASFGDAFSSEHRSKREVLERFLSDVEKLPENFLTTPPFVDSSGYSYAYFLSQKGTEPFNQKQWIEQHLSFFKVSELGDILQKYQIRTPEYLTISRLVDREMEEVIKGASLILTRDYLLIKNQSRLGFSPLSYWVYERQKLYSELKNGKYDLVPYVADALCLQRIGNACWTYNSTYALGYLYRYSLVFIYFYGIVFFIFSCIYIKYVYEKNREQKRHRLALQVLSHEFRTPVSSMLLLIDRLTKEQVRFGSPDHDSMTRLSEEVFRLQRIIEVSKTYLQAESRRIQFKSVEIPSINNWISDFIGEFDSQIICELLCVDQKIEADPFWLKFVLSTLVQNAFAHGKEPVCIRLKGGEDGLKIVVEDQGDCEFNSLKQMSEAFVKSSRSKGMGLGLNIAKFIVNEWGSEIRFSKSPTSFTLFLSLSDGRGQI